jgi:hypothetical protein
MDLKRKPTQVSFQFSRRLFGPDRAEIAERSNNVGPDVDYATHDLIIITRAVHNEVSELRGAPPVTRKQGA